MFPTYVKYIASIFHPAYKPSLKLLPKLVIYPPVLILGLYAFSSQGKLDDELAPGIMLPILKNTKKV